MSTYLFACSYTLTPANKKIHKGGFTLAIDKEATKGIAVYDKNGLKVEKCYNLDVSTGGDCIEVVEYYEIDSN